MKTEVFVEFPEQPYYRISNHGRVVRDEHIITYKNGKQFRKSAMERIFYIDASGYYSFEIRKTHYRIHRVLAELFIPNPDNKAYVNHKDGNKLNYALDNLEWSTPSENNQHAYDYLGKQGSFTGKHSPASKPVGKYKDGQLIQSYPSARNASILHNLHQTTIAVAINRGNNIMGFKWAYL